MNMNYKGGIVNKQLFLVCLMLTSVMLIDRSVFSQDWGMNTWPQFRGINASGVANPDQNPPVKFGAAEKLLWKTPIIPGVSSPCIWGDRIFLTGFDEVKRQLLVLCYERSNGKLIWNRVVPAKEIERFHVTGSPADATPATDGERVYVHFGSYGLLCYDFSGNVLWTHELPINKSAWGTGTSPVIVNNLIVTMIKRPKRESHLLALDSKSGQQIWKQSVPNASHSTPIKWGNELVVHSGGYIAGYRIDDGSEIWHISVKTTGTSTPVVNDTMLYVCTWSQWGEQNQRIKMPNYHDLLNKYDTDQDSLISKQEFPDEFVVTRRPEVQELPGVNIDLANYFGHVDKDKSNYIDNTEWNKYLNDYAQRSIDHGLIAVKSGGAGNVTSSHVLWKESKSVPEVPSPLFYKGRIYMIKNGGIVTCLEAMTGKLLYRARLRVSEPYFSSPIVAKDRIYIASAKGTVVVFATGDELVVLARNNLGEEIKATPAIVDNKLYVRTEGHLYAFSE
jgi:outer membrane protein assembly factor BamB